MSSIDGSIRSLPQTEGIKTRFSQFYRSAQVDVSLDNIDKLYQSCFEKVVDIEDDDRTIDPDAFSFINFRPVDKYIPVARRKFMEIILKGLTGDSGLEDVMKSMERLRILLQIPDTNWQRAYGLVDLMKLLASDAEHSIAEGLPKILMAPFGLTVLLVAEAVRNAMRQGFITKLEQKTRDNFYFFCMSVIQTMENHDNDVLDLYVRQLGASINRFKKDYSMILPIEDLRNVIWVRPEFDSVLQLRQISLAAIYDENAMDDFLHIMEAMVSHPENVVVHLLYTVYLEPLILRGASVENIRHRAFYCLIHFIEDSSLVHFSEEVLMRLSQDHPWDNHTRRETINTARLCLQILDYSVWKNEAVDYPEPDPLIPVDDDVVKYLLLRLDKREIPMAVHPHEMDILGKDANMLHYAANMRTYSLASLHALSNYLGGETTRFLSGEDENGLTPIHYAARSGSSQTLNWCLGFVGVQWLQEPRDIQPVHVVGSKDALNLLVEYGQTLDTTTSMGTLPANCNQNADMLHELLSKYDRGDDIFVRNSLGNNALFHATSEAVIDVLVDHQAPLDQPNKYYQSPLRYHAMRGNTRIVRRLLEKLADVSMTDQEGNCVLHGADEKTLPLLLPKWKAKGRSINHRNGEGYTPAHVASCGALEVLMLDPEFDIEYRDDPTASPKNCPYKELGVSKNSSINEITKVYRDKVRSAHPDKGGSTLAFNSLKMAYDFATDPKKQRGTKGMTPLLSAIAGGDDEIDKVCLLLNAKSQVDSGTPNGRSALYLAVESGRLVTERLLADERARYQINEPCMNEVGQPLPIHAAAVRGDRTIMRLLMKYGASLDSRDADGRPVCHYALDDADLLQWMVDFGANITECNNDGHTLLHLCVSEEIAQLCVDYELNVNQPDNEGLTPLVRHIQRIGMTKNRDLEILQVLLKNNAQIEIQGKTTPLHAACVFGRDDIVKLLLTHQADPNFPCDLNGDRPIMAAAQNGKPDLVNQLITAKADLELPNFCGNTPLHSAILSMDVETVRATFSKTTMDQLNFYGEKPLQIATRLGHTEIADYLTKKGASSARKSTSLKDGNGRQGSKKSVKSVSREGCHKIPDTDVDVFGLACLGRGRQLQKRIGKKTDAALTTNSSGCSIVHAAAIGGNADILKDIVDKCPELLEQQDHAGNTPLFYATHMGNDYYATVETLVSLKANLNAQNKQGQYPVHHAAQHGAVTVLEMLEKKGAQLNVQDNFGNTPLHMAVDEATVNFLMKAGLDPNKSNDSDCSPIEEAAYHGRLSALEAMFPFLQKERNTRSDNLLILACRGHRPFCAQYLLTNGLSVTETDNHSMGLSPLHYISDQEIHVNIAAGLIKKMVKAGADPNSHSVLATPLHSCSDPTILKALLDQGARLKEVNADNRTPQQVYTALGYTANVQYLLDNQLLDFSPDSNGFNLLFYAAQAPTPDVLQLLDHTFEVGDIGHKSIYGTNVLHHIRHRSVLETVIRKAGRGIMNQHMWMNEEDINGRTPLMYALENYRSKEFVTTLLDGGATTSPSNVHAFLCLRTDIFKMLNLPVNPTVDGISLLSQTVKEGDIDHAIWLLEAGAQWDGVSEGPLAGSCIRSPEMLACFPSIIEMINNEHVYTCVWMLQTQIEMRNSDPGFLSKCAQRGQYACVKFLIEQGFDIHYADRTRESPLFLAAKNGHFHVCELLLEHGANVNHENMDHISPLQAAVESDASVEVIILLLQHDADPLHLNRQGRNFVHYCCMKNRTDVLNTIRSHDTFKDILDNFTKDMTGNTPLDLAAKFGNADVLPIFTVRKDVRKLLAQFAESTPLFIAVVRNYSTFVKHLCDSGIMCPRALESALHISVKFDLPNLTTYFIDEMGISVNAIDELGNTPLHNAAYYGAVDICLLLIQRQCFLERENRRGARPIEIALSRDKEIARLITAEIRKRKRYNTEPEIDEEVQGMDCYQCDPLQFQKVSLSMKSLWGTFKSKLPKLKNAYPKTIPQRRNT